MRKAVLISIQGTQCYEGDEPQALELMTNGFYEKQPDRCQILYEETEMTGMEGVKRYLKSFRIMWSSTVQVRWSPKWCSVWENGGITV